MKKGNPGSNAKLFLLILAGVIIGGLVGHFLKVYFDLPLFRESISIGTGTTPISLNLIFVQISLVLNFVLNFGTILGVLIGVLFYVKS